MWLGRPLFVPTVASMSGRGSRPAWGRIANLRTESFAAALLKRSLETDTRQHFAVPQSIRSVYSATPHTIPEDRVLSSDEHQRPLFRRAEQETWGETKVSGETKGNKGVRNRIRQLQRETVPDTFIAPFIAIQLTSWKVARTFVLCRSCWGTKTSGQR